MCSKPVMLAQPALYLGWEWNLMEVSLGEGDICHLKSSSSHYRATWFSSSDSTGANPDHPILRFQAWERGIEYGDSRDCHPCPLLGQNHSLPGMSPLPLYWTPLHNTIQWRVYLLQWVLASERYLPPSGLHSAMMCLMFSSVCTYSTSASQNRIIPVLVSFT